MPEKPFQRPDDEPGGGPRPEGRMPKPPVRTLVFWFLILIALPAALLPFRTGDVPPRDYLGKIPEATGYTLVYDCDPARIGREGTYATDRRAEVTGPFDRVAYMLELQSPGGDTRYAYVSMDAFTDDIAKVGVPVFGAESSFRQAVGGLNVVSNVPGVTEGTDLADGYIEFWPNNYGPGNSAGVAGASGSVYDFGDEPADPQNGYGCMQVHNKAAKQTILAVNHWVAGDGADLGIGNRGEQHPDWTFAGNAGTYAARRLRVFVRLK